MTIHIHLDGEGEWQYDIYLASPEQIAEGEAESLDGGACTSTLQNAIEMASEQAGGVALRYIRETEGEHGELELIR